MRHNDARKWLHAGLDLLPLILIPVFMIYSHRHTIDSGSIEVPQNQVVDFNQNIQNGNFENGLEHFGYNGSSVNVLTNKVSWTATSQYGQFVSLASPSVEGHTYLIKVNLQGVNAFTNSLRIYKGNTLTGSTFSIGQEIKQVDILGVASNSNNTEIYIQNNSASDFNTYYIKDFMLFDLTQMFGSGNEPTISQFNQWYTQDYYDYTLSHKELLKGYSNILYDDTDIMSQFTYQLYNSVDKYFNMGNVFNLGGVYDWFNLNIFAGNASIALYIVWNIVLYEFVMDLLFLLYGLFMWFIDMCKHLMEKPFRSIK